MKFKTVDDAKAAAKELKQHIYVEISGCDGVLEVFPGGRAVFVSADKGKWYERRLKLLTPDKVFDGLRS